MGFLFHAPENVKKQSPQFKPVETHTELLKRIKEVREQTWRDNIEMKVG